MTIEIWNTLTERKEKFRPVDEGKVKIYVCGMTVQDRPHVGHMRAFLAGDVVRRYLEYKGYEVIYIQNFTDIDDKIIERAKRENTDWRRLADRYIEEYLDASDRLNLKRASFYPRAALHIQEIIELVQELEGKGLAYRAMGSVYYDVTKFPEYGKLSKKKLEDLIAGARVEPEPGKRNPFDFALWKARKEGEPYWDSPFGPGRPGWHIECSAMSTHYLGQPFDIHGGGEDLIFPHHENEIAQSEGAKGITFSNFWLHVGYVRLRGEKMSKSTGVFSAVRDVLERFSPNSLRLYLLQTHYRNPIDYSEERLREAEQAWERFQIFFDRVPPTLSPQFEDTSLSQYLKRFEEALDDDFNTPRALAVTYDLLKEANIFLDRGEEKGLLERASLLRMMLNILGFKIEEKSREKTPELLELIIEVRHQLREERNFAVADKIRERLGALGIILEDGKEGTTWRFK
jgi:cysteinyl-tRNA synthetase